MKSDPNKHLIPLTVIPLSSAHCIHSWMLVLCKSVFLKPGVATHLCVAEIHQGVAKNIKLVSELQLTY